LLGRGQIMTRKKSKNGRKKKKRVLNYTTKKERVRT